MAAKRIWDDFGTLIRATGRFQGPTTRTHRAMIIVKTDYLYGKLMIHLDENTLHRVRSNRS